jgi:hypothetical protein
MLSVSVVIVLHLAVDTYKNGYCSDSIDAVCGMVNAGNQANNPAAQFVKTTGIRDLDDLLNFTEDDMASIVKAHNLKPNVTAVPMMLVAKNLEALVYFARYHWRRKQDIIPAAWTPDEMACIKDIMTQIKAAWEDRIGNNIDPGPIDVGPSYYHDWVGHFRNKL